MFFFFQAEDGIRDIGVTGVQTCALPIWHEAADLTLFRPRPEILRQHDLVWIGNWGDEERTAELGEFLIGPVKSMALAARVHGVRYPAAGPARVAHAGIEIPRHLPDFRVPAAFAEGH